MYVVARASVCLVMLAGGRPSIKKGGESAEPGGEGLAALGRLAHKDRMQQLHAAYGQEDVRKAAYAAFSEAAAKAGAGRKPEFGWLGREALIAKYGEAESFEMLAKARQALRDKYGRAGLRAIARKAHTVAASNTQGGAAALDRKSVV